MTRDTFSLFEDRDRGRFGDNEIASEQPEKLTGGSRLVDINMIQHVEMDRPSATLVSETGDRTKAVWLPKSQIQILVIGPQQRKHRGIVVRPVTITLPTWLAKEKGLI